MRDPLVTVFMPVHNRASLVRPAIESVLAQTFTDFELLVIDDGSTDESLEVVRSVRDARLRLVVQESNRGTPKTRNHGLDLARGRYLALLDSDDVALPRRLERQVRFLDARPDIAAVGSWAIGVSRAAGRARTLLVRVTEPRAIRARIPFVSCFKNPTMMVRTEVLRGFRYREEFSVCQDIDVWARMSTRHALANLPAFLVRYRGGGGSHADLERTRRMRILVIRDCLDQMDLSYSSDDLDRHERLRNTRGLRPNAEFLHDTRDWLEELVSANRRAHAYPEPQFAEAAAERWMLVCLAALRARVVPPKLSSRSPLGGQGADVLRTYLRSARDFWRGQTFGDEGASNAALEAGANETKEHLSE